MTDEPFVNQNDVEGTASGVWSRMLAGNRRFAEGKLEHPNRRVVPEKLRTLDHGRPWSDDQFASTRLSSNRDMSR